MMHTHIPSRLLMIFLALLGLTAVLLPGAVQAQSGDTSPWGEVVDENGNIRFDNLTDLGETTQPAEWMDIPLPFGQEIDLDANYHRYETPGWQCGRAALAAHSGDDGHQSPGKRAERSYLAARDRWHGRS